MDAAEGEGKPPPELRLAWMCERWNSLPEPGGLLDQDAATVGRMVVLDNVYSAVDRWNNSPGEMIHSLRESERRLLRWLYDEHLWLS